jgi:hypothetical protein
MEWRWWTGAYPLVCLLLNSLPSGLSLPCSCFPATSDSLFSILGPPARLDTTLLRFHGNLLGLGRAVFLVFTPLTARRLRSEATQFPASAPKPHRRSSPLLLRLYLVRMLDPRAS